MKSLKHIFLLLFCFFIFNLGFAQEYEQILKTKYPYSSTKGKASFGVGAGLPYGGFGLRIGANAIDGLNLFAGLGYQLAGIGYNLGARKEFKSKGNTQFYITGMYGTNGSIFIDGLDDYDKIYTGATVGVGLKFNSKSSENTYWEVGLLVPSRSTEFKNDIDRVKNDPRIQDFTDAWPVLINVGYNYAF